MGDLWSAIAELATTVHADRISAVADAIQRLESIDGFARVESAFGPNVDRRLIARLRDRWAATPQVSPAEIAAALRGASGTAALLEGRGAVELVWSGPRTGIIPTRFTEQVMLEVIDAAETELFLVTFVFYKAASIVEALRKAARRGVDVRILLEPSTDRGGSRGPGEVPTLAEAVPEATIYVWDHFAKAGPDPVPASVHAKCAVADGRIMFITSANLTSAALERNMELGALVQAGDLPRRLRDHLQALVASRVILQWSR